MLSFTHVSPIFYWNVNGTYIYRDTYYIEANLYEFTAFLAVLIILALAGCYRLLCDILISSAYIV